MPRASETLQSTANLLILQAFITGSVDSRPGREVREHGIGAPRADHAHELLARRAPHAGETAERGEQRLPPARPDAGNRVEIGSQVT
jgi:hypothetical protein